MPYPLFYARYLHRTRQVERLCRLAGALRHNLRALPWPELSTAEKRRLDRALDLLESDVRLSRGITAGEGRERGQGG